MSDLTIYDKSQKASFESIRRFDGHDIEFWLARELMKLLGYKTWQKFNDAIDRAKLSCKNSGNVDTEEFIPMSVKTSEGGRPQESYRLTRFACYLIAQNGDPRKEEIALAQSYFAVKTKQAEQPVTPQNYIEALQETLRFAIANQKLEEVNKALQAEVQVLEPKAEAWDLVIDSDGWLSGEDIVKQLALEKFSVKKLYEILRDEKVLFKRPNDAVNRPYAEWVNEKLAKLRDADCYDGKARFSPVFSWKGLDRILDILRDRNIIPKNKQFRFDFNSDKVVAMKRA